jgi:hypothetical protein
MKKLKIKTAIATLATGALLIGFAQAAQAASLTLEIPNGETGQINELNTGVTKNLAIKLPVPELNKIEAENSIRFTITGLEAGVDVSAIATNAYLVNTLDSDASPVKTADGQRSLSAKSIAATALNIYAFTTSDSYGTVSISYLGNTYLYHLIGIPGSSYNLSLQAPTYLDRFGSTTIGVELSDAFGNKVTSELEYESALSKVILGGSSSEFTWSENKERYELTLTPNLGVKELIISVGLDVPAVSGLAAPRTIEQKSIQVRNLVKRIEKLEERIAKLREKFAKAKNKHNGLARQWNKSFPTKPTTFIGKAG